MKQLPLYISIVFVLTTLLTVFFFYKASKQSRTLLIVLLGWLTIQAIVTSTGFYTVTAAMPPRLFLLVLPPLLLIIAIFATAAGRQFADNLDTRMLTVLHIVRVPVELVLFALYLHKMVPVLITFEGRNWDILSGLTAPIVYYLAYRQHKLHKTALLIWNILCLILLTNVVTHAVLSAPLPFQQMAFDQPNVAILHFPFIWLPCCVVPVVLFAHLVCIRRLLNEKKAEGTSRNL